MIDVSLAPKPDDVALFTPNRSFQKGKSVSPPPHSLRKKAHHHNTYNVAGSGHTGSGGQKNDDIYIVRAAYGAA